MRRALLAGICVSALCHAQDQSPTVQVAKAPALIRPYMAPTTAPIHLHNSSRLNNLMRAGNLYLSVADALALAMENNLNLEIARYGPLLADSALERAKAGGPLRGVLPGVSQIAAVNAGVGVSGTIASAGLSGGSGGGGGNGGNGGATIQQVGAVVPNFDPTLQNVTNFSHITTLEPNTVLAGTNSLVQFNHVYTTQLTQGLLTGGSVQYREYQQGFGENAAGDFINPVSATRMDLIVNQPLLQRFGIGLNDRTIRVSAINTTAAREVFRGQLLDLAASVLNLYYNLAAASDELRARQHALEIAQKFYEDTRKEIAAEAIPTIQLPPAAAEVSTRRQELQIAQANVRQQEVLMKEAISHTEDPALEAAGIVLVDRIQIPASDELPSVRDLVNTAMSKRPDVSSSKYRDQTDELNLAGTTNPLLPSFNVQYQTYNRGVAGQGHLVNGQQPNPDFVGGYGRAFQQIVQRDFGNNVGTATFVGTLGNRGAQADYGIEQLQFRQNQMQSQKTINNIVVDVSARVAALRQAHARYDTARDSRILQEQLLASDQEHFHSGGKTVTFASLMADERSLIAAQIAEVSALSAYAHARTSLDQTLGETLEKNNITLDEGLKGHMERQSQIPDVLDGHKQ